MTARPLLGAGDQSNIAGLTVEYSLKSLLVIVPHGGDHHVAAGSYRSLDVFELLDQGFGVGEQLIGCGRVAGQYPKSHAVSQ